MRRKSCPLATICVPTRTSTSPACTAPRVASSAPFLRVLSASMRAIRAPGQQRRELLFEPLGAAPDRSDVGVAALRAAARHRLGESAVVAAQGPVLLVEDAPGAAVRAAAQPAAFAALQDRRVATSIEEDQALVAGADLRSPARRPLAGPGRVPAPPPRDPSSAWRAATCRRAAPPARPHRRSARRASGARSGRCRRVASFRATASPSRARRARLRAGRARSRDRAPSSAHLPAACTTRRAPRRRRSARAAGAARTPRAACRARGRRGRAARRASCAAAAPAVSPLCSATMRRPANRRAEAVDQLRRQVDLGNEHERLVSGSERLRRRCAGRPRSCRCR